MAGTTEVRRSRTAGSVLAVVACAALAVFAAAFALTFFLYFAAGSVNYARDDWPARAVIDGLAAVAIPVGTVVIWRWARRHVTTRIETCALVAGLSLTLTTALFAVILLLAAAFPG
jgi:TRAP-type C4-dicarboxylate transport system permease small subunit